MVHALSESGYTTMENMHKLMCQSKLPVSLQRIKGNAPLLDTNIDKIYYMFLLKTHVYA